MKTVYGLHPEIWPKILLMDIVQSMLTLFKIYLSSTSHSRGARFTTGFAKPMFPVKKSFSVPGLSYSGRLRCRVSPPSAWPFALCPLFPPLVMLPTVVCILRVFLVL